MSHVENQFEVVSRDNFSHNGLMFHSPNTRRRAHERPLALTIAALLVAALAVVMTPRSADAAALPPSITEGGFIISDAEFFDSDSMTRTQIQSFLEGKVPTCRATTGPDCLKDFRSTMVAKSADKYCAAIQGGSNVRASEIIWRVSTACGINPKVLLVMLQKEQGLVTSSAPSNWNIQQAMGQACPDTPTGCDPRYSGFFNQVYYGARQLQVYTKNPNSFNYRAGQVNTIKWHPSSSCGTSKVYIQNQATANLYIYTPYRANVAALAAGYGTGDSCSAYGNRNFYNYYVDWFSPGSSASTGAPAQVAACTTPASNDIASGSGTATVNTASLNARTAPTMKCATGMTSLSKGTSLTVTGAYGMWTRGTTGGKTVWVATQYLTKKATPAPGGSADSCATPSGITAAKGDVTVTSATLNARKAPSTECATGRVSLKLGDKATRTGVYGAWWRVTLASGGTYWIHSDYASVANASTPTPAPTPTPTPTETLQTTASLNLRSKASTSSSIIVVLAKGTKVQVIGSEGAWRKVTVGTRTGWVHSDYLAKPGSSSGSGTTSTAKTTDYLNLREGASTSSKVLATLAKGTTVTITESSGAWRKVKAGTRTGWVHSQYLTSTTSGSTTVTKTTTDSLNLRQSASTSAKVITVLAKGAKVTVTSTKGDWSAVKVGSRSGWVHSSYLTSASSSTTVTKTTRTPLNLRQSASTSAKILTELAVGTKVTVTSTKGTWSAVKVGSRTGWVASAYLK